jgi:predicted AlkP superfamily pyrophosphatase or phosphodiesterase
LMRSIHVFIDPMKVDRQRTRSVWFMVYNATFNNISAISINGLSANFTDQNFTSVIRGQQENGTVWLKT